MAIILRVGVGLLVRMKMKGMVWRWVLWDCRWAVGHRHFSSSLGNKAKHKSRHNHASTPQFQSSPSSGDPATFITISSTISPNPSTVIETAYPDLMLSKARAGVTQQQLGLGHMYRERKDFSKAMECFLEAANAGMHRPSIMSGLCITMARVVREVLGWRWNGMRRRQRRGMDWRDIRLIS